MPPFLTVFKSLLRWFPLFSLSVLLVLSLETKWLHEPVCNVEILHRTQIEQNVYKECTRTLHIYTNIQESKKCKKNAGMACQRVCKKGRDDARKQTSTYWQSPIPHLFHTTVSACLKTYQNFNNLYWQFMAVELFSGHFLLQHGLAGMRLVWFSSMPCR